MDTFEYTKVIGALCGSLLVFLVFGTIGHALYDTHSEFVSYEIAGAEDESSDDGAEAEADVDAAALVAAADPASGERIFKKCGACHKVDGTDGVGPHLNGVVGREAGTVGGFGYSGSLPAGTWNADTLYAFLENPKAYAPGTSMSFAGLKKSEERADLISYLESLSN